MSVEDDGSVTYELDRLVINLKPMTDAELNRLAATNANLELNPSKMILATVIFVALGIGTVGMIVFDLVPTGANSGAEAAAE